MKFSNDTLSILKNFSTINPSVVFKPGSTIRTISPQKTVMAAATIGETVEQQAGVYDLSRFLSTLALFENPEVVFGTDRFTIKGGKSELRYTYTSESLIVTPPEKDIVVPDPEVSINITWQAIDNVLRAAGVLQLPEIAFIGDGNSVTISAVDSKTSTADNYNTVVAEGVNTEPFNMIIKTDNLKLVPTDYEVTLSSKGMAHFKSDKVQYWIAIESR
jgi:hypothetical protein|tara:strand:- start:1735 stop:2385 length:651 start_codon:yes stop_codon:yes gene_type:complete